MTYGTGCVGSPPVRGSHACSSKSPSFSYARGAVKPRSRGAQSARLLSSPIPGSPLPPMALERRRWAGGGGGQPRRSRVPLPPPSGASSSANRSSGGRSSCAANGSRSLLSPPPPAPLQLAHQRCYSAPASAMEGMSSKFGPHHQRPGRQPPPQLSAAGDAVADLRVHGDPRSHRHQPAG
jgi:hypothetical protein